MQLLFEIFQVCLIPLLGYLTTRLISYINAKRVEVLIKQDSILEEKYINMLSQTITDCVLATNQTYVDTLKAQGSFDAAAQKIAFEKTYQAVLSILSEDAIEYLREGLGDLEKYIQEKIEAEVKNNKN